MFNAEIDRVLHEDFIQHLMDTFKLGRNKAEKAVLQMEKDVEEMWNNPSKFYKELEELKSKSESNE